MRLLIGQGLIALGAGGIKPCVSSHLGDQFRALNHHWLSKVFGWIYFFINLGAFAAMLIISCMLSEYGASMAFAMPGVLMLLATIAFWCGRYRFIHIPPAGKGFVAEVMVSITCLEFSYTQAPRTMKSFVMALFFLSVALGNLFTSAVNFFILNDDGSSKLTGAEYFWFFTVLMLITAILFIAVSCKYREKTYLHEEMKG